MYTPLLHYIAIDEAKKSIDLFVELPDAVVKSHPIDDLLNIAKATHIFGKKPDDDERQPLVSATPAPKPTTLVSATPATNPSAGLVSPAPAPKSSAGLVSPAGRSIAAPTMGPGSPGFQPPVKKEHEESPAVISTDKIPAPAAPSGKVLGPAGSAVSSAKPKPAEPFRGQVDLGAKPASSLVPAQPVPVARPSAGLVSEAGKKIATEKPMPTGFRGTRTELQATTGRPVHYGVSAVRNVPSPLRTEMMKEAARGMSHAAASESPKASSPQSAWTPSGSNPQATSPAAAPPSAFSASTPRTEIGVDSPARSDQEPKEKKPSLLFRPEGEEAPAKTKRRGYTNIMGAYSTGASLAPGGPGSGTRVLGVAGWKTALGAHRLLNRRRGGYGYSRQMAGQMGPQMRTGFSGYRR